MTLTAIEGGGEPVLKPELIMEDGKMCMRVHLGAYSATLTLPERLAGATVAELQGFFDIAVPEMTKGLVERRNKDAKKLKKKAKML